MGSHYISNDCANCGACADACPVEAIREGAQTYMIRQDLCTDCGACLDACPVDAIAYD